MPVQPSAAGPAPSRLAHTITSSLYAKLPYHPLHDGGYASIGCTHCTQPGTGREGRWAGSEKTECGIHYGFTDGEGI